MYYRAQQQNAHNSEIETYFMNKKQGLYFLTKKNRESNSQCYCCYL